MRRFIRLLRPLVERCPRAAALYRGVRDQIDYAREPLLTPWGFKLAGNAAMASGSFEPEATRLVREILSGVDVLVNVGANVGYYCCHALSMGRPVIAFEPLQRNVRYLCKNIRSNGWSGAEIHPIALSNAVGILDIYGSGTGASVIKGWAGIPEAQVTLVPAATMDLVIGPRLRGRKALVLVDVEGAEKLVLDGASQLLANDPKPTWLMEICFTENQRSGVNKEFTEIFELFWSHGYRALSVEGNMCVVSAEDIQRWHKQQARDFGYVSYLFDDKLK
jgi:FkbM family methyltransferase